MVKILFSLLILLIPTTTIAEPLITLNLPLTGSLATYGSSIQEGVTLAAEEQNCNECLSFNWEDNQSQPKTALSAALKQLKMSPWAYVSGVKPQFMTIRDHVNASGIPHFAWVFDMHIRSGNEKNFRTWVNFQAELPLFRSYALKRAPKRIAIIYVQLPHTEEAYNKNLLPDLKNAGFSEIRVEPYQWELNDFRSLAIRIKQFNPDLLFISGFKENLFNLIPSFHNAGLIKGANTVVSYDLIDAAPELNKKQIEDIRVTAPSFILTNDIKTQQWKNRFNKRFNKQPLYTHAYAYDMASILFDASKRTGKDGTAEDFQRAIEKTNLEGITGPLRFDSSGDIPANISLGMIKNGVIVTDD